MIRFGSGVAVLALKTAVAVGGILLAAGCAPQASGRVNRHVVPASLVHVALEDFDVVSFLDVDLHTAVQTREAVESEFSKAYGHAGHPRWFFHAFDGANLDFVVARYEPTSAKSPRYVAQRRLRVKRSREAERALAGAGIAGQQIADGRRERLVGHGDARLRGARVVRAAPPAGAAPRGAYAGGGEQDEAGDSEEGLTHRGCS